VIPIYEKTQSNNFDVLKRMAAENKDIRLCTTVTDANFNHKHGTKVTIGVPGNVCFDLSNGKLDACLLLFNAAEFAELKARMQEDAAGTGERGKQA
jgi:hypothetical protein